LLHKLLGRKNSATEVHDFDHLLPDPQSVIELAAGSQSNPTQLNPSSSRANDDAVDLSSDDEEVKNLLQQGLEVVQKWSVPSFDEANYILNELTECI
jgi:hypothetical protein